MPSVFGQSIKRREDPRLITGQGIFTDDVQLPGMAYAVFVRSPHAHAKIKSINSDKARAMPGVVAVVTGADIKDKLGSVPCAWPITTADIKMPPHPVLAFDTVRYVGDAVAVVVAEDRYTARDAADAVEVDYEVLPAVVDAKKATEDGQPQVHPETPNNTSFHWKTQGGDFDAAFANPEVKIEWDFINQRLIPMAMEPRAAIAQYSGGMNELTLWSTSQNPHIARFLLSLVTNIPEHKIRVISTEIGGGFGSKIPLYADECMVAYLARSLKRPIKWTEERRENFLTTIHGRDHNTHVELAAKKDGTITGLRGTTYANLGAYLSTAAPGVPTWLHGLMLPGAYTLPAIDYHVYGVMTNTTPVDAYRGAGRPEATYIIERLVDQLAAELNMDPADVRKKNLIPKFDKGHTTVTTLIYDSGDYETALNMALEMVDYKNFRADQAEARKEGKYMGIGLCTYAEICGLAPSNVGGALGFGGGLWESAVVRCYATGKVHVFIGANPHGQGEETTFAQIVAEEFGIPTDDVEIVHGDTDNTPMGWGTYGSRTTPVAGSAVVVAARRVKEKAKKIAALLLEASEDDIVFEDGKFFVRGVPMRMKSFADIALEANVFWHLDQNKVEPGLEANAFYDPSNFVYPFGTHIAVVEVDSETGQIEVKRYIAVDDCGNIINPMIVEGQIHGGVTQGIAQALYEHAVYDENGQLLTGSLNDYAVPTAAMVPHFETHKTTTPAPGNPLGVKGIGETGTIASTPAIANAVMDALAPFGVKDLNMPFTPEKVWNAMQGGK